MLYGLVAILTHHTKILLSSRTRMYWYICSQINIKEKFNTKNSAGVMIMLFFSLEWWTFVNYDFQFQFSMHFAEEWW